MAASWRCREDSVDYGSEEEHEELRLDHNPERRSVGRVVRHAVAAEDPFGDADAGDRCIFHDRYIFHAAC